MELDRVGWLTATIRTEAGEAPWNGSESLRTSHRIRELMIESGHPLVNLSPA